MSNTEIDLNFSPDLYELVQHEATKTTGQAFETWAIENPRKAFGLIKHIATHVMAGNIPTTNEELNRRVAKVILDELTDDRVVTVNILVTPRFRLRDALRKNVSPVPVVSFRADPS